MIFLNVWAFGLLGLAGVIVALYFLRRREERWTVSALWLWGQEPEHPRSALTFLWTKIGLLLVQLAALGALVFALAAPTLPREFFGGGTLAVIIDGSASMQTRYERAIALATELITRRRPNRLTVIQAQQHPRVLVPWTTQRDQALAAVQASRPTLQGNAHGSSVLQLLRSQGELENYDEVLYISDHRPDALAGTVTWVPVGEPRENGAITGFAARLLPESAQGVVLWASIENFSSRAISGTLRFFAGDAEIAHEYLYLQPGERRSVEALAAQSLGGRFRAVLEVADDFPFDNVRYAVIPTRPKLKVLWLGERNFFLERALQSFSDAEITVLSDPSDTDRINTESYDLAIAYNTESRALPLGRFLFINSSIESVVRISEDAVPAGAPQLLQPAHPLVQNVHLEHFQTPSLHSIEFALPVQTLIAADGQPILAAHRSGSLSFVWVGIDLRTSPLVLTPSFPIFVQNATRWLLAEESSPSEQFVSEEFPTPGFTEQGAVNLDPRESQEVGGQTPVSAPPAQTPEDKFRTRAQVPIWHYGAWLALGLLVLELLWYLRQAPQAHHWATLLRVGAWAMLLLALAGPRFAQGDSERYIYFLIDRSASVGGDSTRILQIVRALAPPAEKTFYGVISFGAEPAIEMGFAPMLQLTEFQTEPDGTATDIASAVRLALETFPRSGRREIVLLTDGQLTSRDLSVLARARREGVPIHVWPLGEESPEAWVYDLQIPAEVAPTLPFPIRVQLGATTAGHGTLLLYRNGELVQALSVQYSPGVHEVRLVEKLDAPGAYSYRIYLKAEPDRLKENNELHGATLVPGDPRVLLVERASGESPVARLLRSAGFAFAQDTFERFAANPVALSGYKTVILNNIPLGRLTAEHRRALKQFVANGGGLFLIQGRQAVTDLDEQTPHELADWEELLPVSYLAPEPYQIPGLALVFVMDRSGSMGDPAGRGIPKIEILKRAALRSLEVLDQDDWVGLIAFDTDYSWIVPLRPLGDGRQFSTSIQSLTANGGTDLYFALKAAFDALEKTPARIKHILVFTDGHNNNRREREYRELYERLAKSSVRVSTLGIDRTPNEEFLMELAAAGRGRYQRVPEFTDLPVFSLREVRRIARLRWIEGQSAVVASSDSIDLQALRLPPLQGYALTYERPSSQTVLRVSPDGDPLLAFHAYGLGHVGVLNTDLEGEGSRDWLAQADLGKLIGPAIARVHRLIPQTSDVAIQTSWKDGGIEIIADVREGNQWVSGLDLQAKVTGPTSIPVLLAQVAPGRYRARLDSLPLGLYTMQVTAQREGRTLAEVTRPLAVPYPPEYRYIGVNIENLSRIARETGGQFLERPLLPPPSRGIGQESSGELWPWALALALGLFIADLAARKLWGIARFALPRSFLI